MKHPEHQCAMNDGEQTCDCYDKGFKAGQSLVSCIYCGKKFIQVDKHRWKPDCDCLNNYTLISVG